MCRWSHGLIALFASVLLGGASSGGGRAPVAYDLVEGFPSADVQAETDLIKLGEPDADRFLAGAGWQGNDRTGVSLPFRWGVGERSEIRFFLAGPRPINLIFRCRPFRFKGAPPQRVAISVNGQPVEEVTLKTYPARYSVEIPPRLLIAGQNQLVFQYAWSERPADLHGRSHDTTPLAVGWDWLELRGAMRAPPPQVVRDGPRAAVFLPAGTQVDYYAQLAPGSVLTLAEVAPSAGNSGAPAPRLEIEVQTDSMPPRLLDRGRADATGRRVIPLPLSAQEPARVSFRVTAEGEAQPPAAGWRVVEPILHSPMGGGALPADASLGREGRPQDRERKTQRPNVIIYLIDTLRADHLGCYGYERPTSPHIDAFAREATLFARTSAQSSHTRPSVATIFTGLDPRVHAVQDGKEALPESAVTLAERLQQAGYETAGLVTNGNISTALGFGQGFGEYVMLDGPDGATPTSEEVNAAAFEWLAKRRADRPFFLYLHSVDPHQPYTPPSPYRERFAPGVDVARLGAVREHLSEMSEADRNAVVRLYDAEIAFNDAGVGALLEKLRALGLYDGSLIILVADHGEEFYDHGGWLHGRTLYDEQLRVPLVIKFPDGLGAGTRVEHLAQQVDILPTVLTYVGQDVPEPVHGRNLLPLLTAGNGPQPPAFAARVRPGSAMESVSADSMKLIRNLYGRFPPIELYDLANDPREQHNLAAERPVGSSYLRTLLRASQPRQGELLRRAQAQLGEGQEERLRALGYDP